MITDELKNHLNTEFSRERSKWRDRNNYFYADLLRFFRYCVPEQSKVLEIGVDDGWLLHGLKPERGVVLGASKTLNEQGHRNYPGLSFIEDSWSYSIPLAEKFDYIILNNVIGLVDDIQPFFTRLHQVSGPKSRIMVSYYNHLWEPFVKFGEKIGLKQKQPVQNWLASDDVALLLDLAGFEVVKSGRRLLFPFYVPVLSWFLNRFVAKLPLINRLAFWDYVMARPKDGYKKNSDYSVSVVVPARNEKGNILGIINRLPEMGKWTELIFIENDSTDGTLEEIENQIKNYKGRLRLRCASNSGGGKIAAVRKGFTMAEGDILMILDADMTVPPEDLPRFYEVMASGHAEYVHGSRLVYPMDKGAMRALNLIGNKCFSLIFTWLLKQRIKDTLCGTKVLFKTDYVRLDANRNYFGDFDRWGDFELIFGVHKLGLKMVEIPVHYKERKYGQSNMQSFRHGWHMLKMCVFAWRKLE